MTCLSFCLSKTIVFNNFDDIQTIVILMNFTRLTRGAWPALPIFTEHVIVTARGSGTHLDIGAHLVLLTTMGR